MWFGHGQKNKAKYGAKAQEIMMKLVNSKTAMLAVVILMTGCFGVANKWGREEMLRDPNGYERKRIERRKEAEKDAAKYGIELPPYEPNKL